MGHISVYAHAAGKQTYMQRMGVVTLTTSPRPFYVTKLKYRKGFFLFQYVVLDGDGVIWHSSYSERSLEKKAKEMNDLHEMGYLAGVRVGKLAR